VATSTYIHARIRFNFSQILDTRSTIKQHYNVLLNKHEEPFKTIAKMTTDVSLITISASIEDLQDVIKALPQTTEVDMPGPPKRYLAVGIAIAAMALSSFNAYRITKLLKRPILLKKQMLPPPPAPVQPADGQNDQQQQQGQQQQQVLTLQ
jgi:hypothetical protein